MGLLACEEGVRDTTVGSASVLVPPVLPGYELDANERKTLAYLKGSIKARRALPHVKGEVSSTRGRVVLHAAARETDTDVVVAMLRALPRYYSPSSPEALQPGGSYEQVVLLRLSGASARVQQAALIAAEPLLQRQNPSSTVANRAAELATSGEGELRIPALQLLLKGSDSGFRSLLHTALLDALVGESAAVQALAARELRRRASALSSEHRERLRSNLSTARSSGSPLLQGLLLDLELAASGATEDWLGRAVEWLKHPSPYVRARAAENLGQIRHTESASRLIPLLDDDARAAISVRWKTPEGSQSLEYAGSRWPTVSHAALVALERMSSGSLPRSKVKESADLVLAVRRAKAWHAKQQATLKRGG